MTMLPIEASGRNVSHIADFTLSDFKIHLFQDRHSGRYKGLPESRIHGRILAYHPWQWMPASPVGMTRLRIV
jgi:hypothetical protein